MKRYRFSDGVIVEASCKEEAIKQHKVVAKKSKLEQDYRDAIKKELSKVDGVHTIKDTPQSLIIKLAGIKGGLTIFLTGSGDELDQLRLNYSDIIETGSDKEYIVYDVWDKSTSQVAKEFKQVVSDLYKWYVLNRKVMYGYDMR